MPQLGGTLYFSDIDISEDRAANSTGESSLKIGHNFADDTDKRIIVSLSSLLTHGYFPYSVKIASYCIVTFLITIYSWSLWL